jgi:hypothetical protein
LLVLFVIEIKEVIWEPYLIIQKKLFVSLIQEKINGHNHFKVTEDGMLHPKTLIGEATIKIFGFNHPDSIIERQLLISVGLYP